MKKLLLAGCLLMGTVVFGQILSEDFNSVSAPGLPSGWSSSSTTPGAGDFYTGNDGDANAGGYWPVPTHGQFAMANDDVCNCTMTAVYLETPSMNFTGKTGVAMTYNTVDDGTYGGNPHSVEVSVNGGAWSNVYTHAFNANIVWEGVLVSLGAGTDNQADVRVRFKYDDGGGWATGVAIDDVVIDELPANEVEMTSLGMAAYAAAGNMSITGVVTNLGGTPITSIDIDWNDGTSHNETFTVNIASGATYNFTHGTPLTVVGGTTHNMTVTVTLAGDANASNNTLSASIAGLSTIPVKNVVGEEKTGTWCGWCPRGAVGLAGMEATAEFIGIAVHNNDPMAIAAYDNGTAATHPNFTGYPHGCVDRVLSGDPSTFSSLHSQRVTAIVPCDVQNVIATYNSTSGDINVSADAEFYGTVAGDYRLSLVITRDDMIASGSGWSQVNYYSGGNPLVDPVSGFDWQAASDPVAPSAFGGYDHAGVYLSGNSVYGNTGSLPAGSVPMGTHNYSFAGFAASSMAGSAATFDYAKAHAVVMIVNSTTGEILNATSEPITLITSAEDIDVAQYKFNVYPNPTTDVADVTFSLDTDNAVKMEIYNAMGSIVYTEDATMMKKGNHNITFDGSDLTNGIYFVNLTIGDQSITKKVSLLK
jgi:hypothetical protein